MIGSIAGDAGGLCPSEADMTLDDDDMTTPPQEPDSGTPADAAAGTNTDYDGGADGGADSGADSGADGGAAGNDPTTEEEDDPRMA